MWLGDSSGEMKFENQLEGVGSGVKESSLKNVSPLMGMAWLLDDEDSIRVR